MNRICVAALLVAAAALPSPEQGVIPGGDQGVIPVPSPERNANSSSRGNCASFIDDACTCKEASGSPRPIRGRRVGADGPRGARRGRGRLVKRSGSAPTRQIATPILSTSAETGRGDAAAATWIVRGATGFQTVRARRVFRRRQKSARATGGNTIIQSTHGLESLQVQVPHQRGPPRPSAAPREVLRGVVRERHRGRRPVRLLPPRPR